MKKRSDVKNIGSIILLACLCCFNMAMTNNFPKEATSTDEFCRIDPERATVELDDFKVILRPTFEVIKNLQRMETPVVEEIVSVLEKSDYSANVSIKDLKGNKLTLETFHLARKTEIEISFGPDYFLAFIRYPDLSFNWNIDFNIEGGKEGELVSFQKISRGWHNQQLCHFRAMLSKNGTIEDLSYSLISPNILPLSDAYFVNNDLSLNLEEYIDFHRNLENVRVAVVDNMGIDYNNNLLAYRIPRLLSGLLVGYSTDNGDSFPFPRPKEQHALHGTQVSSVLTFGSSNVLLIPIRSRKVSQKSISFAVENGAKILVNTNVMEKGEESVELEKQIISHPELLVIASAGNQGQNLEVEPLYPAASNGKNLLVVGGIDSNYKIDPNSNYSPKFVQIAAPYTVDSPVYGRLKGTSFSAPLVARAAAAVLAANPKLNAQQIKNILLETADKYPELEKFIQGGRVLNEKRAIQRAEKDT